MDKLTFKNLYSTYRQLFNSIDIDPDYYEMVEYAENAFIEYVNENNIEHSTIRKLYPILSGYSKPKYNRLKALELYQAVKSMSKDRVQSVIQFVECEYQAEMKIVCKLINKVSK